MKQCGHHALLFATTAIVLCAIPTTSRAEVCPEQCVEPSMDGRVVHRPQGLFDAGEGLSRQKAVGLSLAGAGVVGLGVGTVFGLMARSVWHNAKVVCGGDGSQCSDPGMAKLYRDTMQRDGLISAWGFIAGSVLVAGGIAVYWIGRARGSNAAVVIIPNVGANHAEFAVRGPLPW